MTTNTLMTPPRLQIQNQQQAARPLILSVMDPSQRCLSVPREFALIICGVVHAFYTHSHNFDDDLGSHDREHEQ